MRNSESRKNVILRHFPDCQEILVCHLSKCALLRNNENVQLGNSSNSGNLLANTWKALESCLLQTLPRALSFAELAWHFSFWDPAFTGLNLGKVYLCGMKYPLLGICLRLGCFDYWEYGWDRIHHIAPVKKTQKKVCNLVTVSLQFRKNCLQYYLFMELISLCFFM